MDKFLAVAVLGVTIVCTYFMLSWLNENMQVNVIKYDCRLAEISVDYPQAVKEQCRKLLEK